MALDNHPLRIGVLGLGYVGLPLALAFSKSYSGTVGFDLNEAKIASINNKKDPTDEGLTEELKQTSLKVSSDPAILRGVTFFVVGVPTPVDINHSPDLEPLRSACEIIGKVLRGGETIVFESTVYPGVTEEFCGPLLAKYSGLKLGVDFKLGYSPERINPGDKEHQLSTITKVVSGQDAQTLELVASVYSSVVKAGIHRAPSIKVAEAAKVIENTQRDLNIALMNELSIIFDKMGIATKDVLTAAGTKWNFLKFTPGLVGGHCIGVDPYYLTTKAEQLGYHPEVILAGRRINDSMGKFVAQKTVKLLVNAGVQLKGARVAVLGITFKENVTDIRNSRVPDIVHELREFGVQVIVHDPVVNAKEVQHEYDIALAEAEQLMSLDGIVFAVPHKELLAIGSLALKRMLKERGVIVDVKAALQKNDFPAPLAYWSL